MSGGRGTEVLQAVAYPPHMFYAPIEVWILNLVICAVLASTFEQPLMFVFVGPIIHVAAMQWYRRDPHVFSVTIATFDTLVQRRGRDGFGARGWTFEP